MYCIEQGKEDKHDGSLQMVQTNVLCFLSVLGLCSSSVKLTCSCFKVTFVRFGLKFYSFKLEVFKIGVEYTVIKFPSKIICCLPENPHWIMKWWIWNLLSPPIFSKKNKQKKQKTKKTKKQTKWLVQLECHGLNIKFVTVVSITLALQVSYSNWD